jgi:hypothetical protein
MLADPAGQKAPDDEVADGGVGDRLVPCADPLEILAGYLVRTSCSLFSIPRWLRA